MKLINSITNLISSRRILAVIKEKLIKGESPANSLPDPPQQRACGQNLHVCWCAPNAVRMWLIFVSGQWPNNSIDYKPSSIGFPPPPPSQSQSFPWKHKIGLSFHVSSPARSNSLLYADLMSLLYCSSIHTYMYSRTERRAALFWVWRLDDDTSSTDQCETE